MNSDGHRERGYSEREMKKRPLFKFQNVFCAILLFLSLLCLPYMCSVSRSEDLSTRIDSIRKDHDLMGGVVVVFCKDRVLESIPFGTADHARNIPVSDSTAFRYYPSTPITCRMLLSHTSGIIDGDTYSGFLSASYNDDPIPDISEILSPSGSQYSSTNYENTPPGTYFHYSSLNFGILGTVVERVTGTRFDESCFQNIFLPLDIDGSFNVNHLMDIDDVAVLYRKRGGEWVAQAGDSRFTVKKDVLTVYRTRPDGCKRVPERIRLTFKLREIGIDPNRPFEVANRIATAWPIAREPDPSPADAVVEACREDLARRLGIDAGLIDLVRSTEAVWPDAAMGLRQAGEIAAQVLTPGHRLTFIPKPRGREYLYHAGERGFRYGGPLELWAVSALTIEGGENDPNLNGRLIQLALTGTNREVLLDGVSDAYPQDDGSFFAKRRTSRSGHELLYAPPGRAREANVVATAFDFVDAAVSPGGRLAAAIARTGPELAWEIVLVPLPPGAGSIRRVGIPEGLKPADLRWPAAPQGGVEGQPPVLIGNREGKELRFGLLDLETAPRWESLPSYVASEERDFVLSKSHSLAVYGTDVEGRPAVRVEYVWWNRPPEEIATVRDLKLEGQQWVCGREFVFITGSANQGFKAVTVDIDTGEVLTAAAGARNPVKLLRAPPAGSPSAGSTAIPPG